MKLQKLLAGIGRNKVNIFGLENRRKNSKIINDTISFSFYLLFILWISWKPIQLPVGLSVTFSSATALSSSAVAAAVL